MSGEYYEEPDLLFQGLLRDANAISASAAAGVLYSSPSPAGTNVLRPLNTIITETLISSTHSITATIGLYFVPPSGSVSAGCSVLPDVTIPPNTFTRLTFATILRAGGSIRGSSSIDSKVCLTISGVRRTPRQP